MVTNNNELEINTEEIVNQVKSKYAGKPPSTDEITFEPPAEYDNSGNIDTAMNNSIQEHSELRDTEDEDVQIIHTMPVHNVSSEANVSPIKKDENNISSSNNIQLDDSILNTIDNTQMKMILSEESFREAMPNLPEDVYLEERNKLNVKLDAHMKDLIINEGFNKLEAFSAAQSKLSKDGKEINNKYLEDNPQVGIINIDKTNVDSLQLTADERAKLVKTKTIKLNVIENKDLNFLNIKKIDKKYRAEVINELDGSISKYSIPLPLLSDYVTFKGAQISQLMALSVSDNEPIDQLISKKALFIYDRLVGGMNLSKYYPNTNRIQLSYEDFVNEFKYYDMNLALYAILIASSTDTSEASPTCSKCNKQYTQSYNLKSLLNFDGIKDNFKEIFDIILGNRSNANVLKEQSEKINDVKRYQSPCSLNVYDISQPSINKAIQLLKMIDQDDAHQMYLFGNIMPFIDNVYLYDKTDESHIPIEWYDDDTKAASSDFINAIAILPQDDVSMLASRVKELAYSPSFILNSKCTFCGTKMKNNIPIEQLVFLKAQDSMMEIQ